MMGKRDFMKIAIYGTGNYALRLLRRLEDTKIRTKIMGEQQWDYDVVYYIESIPSKESFYGKRVVKVNQINWDDFDFLVIAIRHHEAIKGDLKKYVKGYEKNKRKVVHSLEFTSSMQQNIAISPYTSCNVAGGLKFLFNTMDRAIGEEMLTTKHTYSELLIQAFFILAQRHCGYVNENMRGKIFLDIGANIGTTSIYVKKIVNPELRVIGIEPGKNNYDLFRVNCILNNVEEIEAKEIGLSNNNNSKKYVYINTNPGGSYVVGENICGENVSNVSMQTLDEFCSGGGIGVSDIGYIWLDTEGAESEIIEGGMTTLSSKRIPLMQEYNPIAYKKRGTYENYLNNMKILYSNFIDMSDYLTSNIEVIKETIELEEYTEKIVKNGKSQTDLFFF